jgi:hypothetical protein
MHARLSRQLFRGPSPPLPVATGHTPLTRGETRKFVYKTTHRTARQQTPLRPPARSASRPLAVAYSANRPTRPLPAALERLARQPSPPNPLNPPRRRLARSVSKTLPSSQLRARSARLDSKLSLRSQLLPSAVGLAKPTLSNRHLPAVSLAAAVQQPAVRLVRNIYGQCS